MPFNYLSSSINSLTSKSVKEQTQSVIWAPDGSGTATTFIEAYTKALSKTIPTTVYLSRNSNLDANLTIPAGTWNVQYMYATTFMYGNPEINQLILEDGAVLLNPSEIVRSCSVRSISSSPVIQFTLDPAISPPVIFVGLGAVILNDGTSPAYISPNNSFTILALDGGSIEGPGLNSQPIIQLGSNAQCFLRMQTGAHIDPTAITGPITSAVIVSHDGTSKFGVTGIDLPGFLGVKVNKPLGMNGGAGPTSFRPDTSDITDLPSIGCYYFDTNLGYTINWNGIVWVDSTGALA